jgi:hypothetical protein
MIVTRNVQNSECTETKEICAFLRCCPFGLWWIIPRGHLHTVLCVDIALPFFGVLGKSGISGWFEASVFNDLRSQLTYSTVAAPFHVSLRLGGLVFLFNMLPPWQHSLLLPDFSIAVLLRGLPWYLSGFWASLSGFFVHFNLSLGQCLLRFCARVIGLFVLLWLIWKRFLYVLNTSPY